MTAPAETNSTGSDAAAPEMPPFDVCGPLPIGTTLLEASAFSVESNRSRTRSRSSCVAARLKVTSMSWDSSTPSAT